MRHLEVANSLQCNPMHFDIKVEDLQNIQEIKQELPEFILSDCDNIIKNNFQNDSLNDLDLSLSPNSSISETYDLNLKQTLTPRRNRRKALQPQRAIHSEVSQSGSIGNSSECSQDASDNIFLKFMGHDGIILNCKPDLFMSDCENDVDLPEGDDLLQDIDEENIFKGLREETSKLYLLNT